MGKVFYYIQKIGVEYSTKNDIYDISVENITK